MEDIKDYFNPINKESFNQSFLKEGSYGYALLNNSKPLLSNNAAIAIIGITETRNSYPQKYSVSIDAVREYFYKLSEINRINVIDLGNLKPGQQVKDTYASITHISNVLISNGIIPLFIGGSQDTTLPILSGITQQIKEPELALIDSFLDIDNEDFHSKSYFHTLLNQFGNKLLVSIIGYQTYFAVPNQLRFLADNHIEAVRLGNVRNSMTQAEPILRDADLVSFDLSSVRQPDCPASTSPGPNGFYSEEACQLANLSGLSDKLKAFAICEYQSDKDTNGQSAHLVAQLMWHFIFGISQRKGDFPAKDLSTYKKIYVRFDKTDSDLVFYQNELNNRFWVEIPINATGNKRIISCSERDYLDICNNEIPDRIWKNISKYLK
ncbi:MAG: arginase family protein [Salinivirgaceae bacterium]